MEQAVGVSGAFFEAQPCFEAWESGRPRAEPRGQGHSAAPLPVPAGRASRPLRRESPIAPPPPPPRTRIFFGRSAPARGRAAPPRSSRPAAPRRERAGAPAARPAPLRSPGDVGPSWATASAGRPSPAAPPTAEPVPTTESLGPGRAAPPPPARTCRGPGRASRRRPPKEGPKRRGCAPIRPRAAPTANERLAAAGRAGTGRGGAAL